MTKRILGIDPGSVYTGYGIIDFVDEKCTHIISGRIQLKDMVFTERLGKIYSEIQLLIEDYQPTDTAIEQVFMAKNASSALKLGQARGAAVTAAVINGQHLYEYAPKLVKQALVGRGAADKSQVGHMVRVLLSINQPLTEDQGDALAVALCHAHISETERRLSQGNSW